MKSVEILLELLRRHVIDSHVLAHATPGEQHPSVGSSTPQEVYKVEDELLPTLIALIHIGAVNTDLRSLAWFNVDLTTCT